MPQVDICVATLRRPRLLLKLLETLEALRLPEDISARIIVIDNDPAESARQVVESLPEKLKARVVYDVEPERGISYARNRALSHVNAEYVAFVDDDEFVESDWLVSLLAAMRHFDADVVFGPVCPVLPMDAPKWAVSQPCFRRAHKKTGSVELHGATGNVFMKSAALGNPAFAFDPAYALTGGGDTDFFFRLHRAGRVMIWCDKAIVYEDVPPERLTTSWVYRRAFRGGQCFARTFVARQGVLRRIAWATKKVIHLVAGGVLLPLALVHSYSSVVRVISRISGTFGQLTGLLSESYLYREYLARESNTDSDVKSTSVDKR